MLIWLTLKKTCSFETPLYCFIAINLQSYLVYSYYDEVTHIFNFCITLACYKHMTFQKMCDTIAEGVVTSHHWALDACQIALPIQPVGW
jgi:hypothetical protein